MYCGVSWHAVAMVTRFAVFPFFYITMLITGQKIAYIIQFDSEYQFRYILNAFVHVKIPSSNSIHKLS